MDAVRIADGKIQLISLARTPFTDAQLSYLKALPHLERLNLEATDVSDAGLESLSKLTTLRDLNLNFTSVSDRGFASLSGLIHLRRLLLSGVRAEGAGFTQLAALTELTELDLTATPVTDDALTHREGLLLKVGWPPEQFSWVWADRSRETPVTSEATAHRGDQLCYCDGTIWHRRNIEDVMLRHRATYQEIQMGSSELRFRAQNLLDRSLQRTQRPTVRYRTEPRARRSR